MHCAALIATHTIVWVIRIIMRIILIVLSYYTHIQLTGRQCITIVLYLVTLQKNQWNIGEHFRKFRT